MIEDAFEISGYSDLPQCPEKCLVGWLATRNHIYLFGDVTENQDLGVLVELAQSIVAPGSGWSKSSSARKSNIDKPVLVPAAIYVIELNEEKSKAA